MGVIIISICILISVMMLTLLERQYMGKIQRRTGPSSISINYRFGIIQPIYDGLKLFIKEIIHLLYISKLIYILTPVIFIVIGILIYSIIPLYLSMLIITLLVSYNIIIIFIISSFSSYSILLSGISSNSIYSILGSIRCISQLISYEVYIGIIMIILLYSISYSFISDNLNILYIFIYNIEYLLIIGNIIISIIFFISIIGETNRSPLDISEAESELVSGWNTEYSAIEFAGFMIGEYSIIIILSYIWSSIFLINLFTIFIILLILLLRGTYCRLKQDVLLIFGWKYILLIVLFHISFILYE